jgi:hypothetical protein
MLQYFGGKLFLLLGPHDLYVLDTRGKSLARMELDTEGTSTVSAFSIDHPSKRNYPRKYVMKGACYGTLPKTGHYELCRIPLYPERSRGIMMPLSFAPTLISSLEQ